MIAMVMMGIEAIDNIAIAALGQMFVLRQIRPIGEARLVAGVRALHLLQQ